jgi:outer membrane protein assembly factor BamB
MRTATSLVLLLIATTMPWRTTRADAVSTIYGESGVTGGFVVELGLISSDFSARLAQVGTIGVQTLDDDLEKVARARSELEDRGLYGRITVEHLSGDQLPYADNLINMIVVHESSLSERIPPDELMRVLVPGGVLVRNLQQEDATGPNLIRKPWPEEIDQWTHFLHGADGNAVAADRRVAPATALQWIEEPKYCRSHEIDSSLPAMVSANGRLFYILDEGPIGITDPRFPARWMLLARDAFNGVLLWKQPLEPWGWQQWKPELREADWRTLRGQRGRFPAEIPRRLVAVGQRVYTTLAFHNAPLSILDAASGEILVQCDGTEGTQEIVVDGENVFVRVRPSGADEAARRGETVPTKLVALDAASGKTRWVHEAGNINTLTLTADQGAVVYLRGRQLVCHEQQDGRVRWAVESPRSTIVVIHQDVVLTTGKEGSRAFSLADGTHLWKGPNTGRDLLVIDDLVWRVQEAAGILAQREEPWPTLSRRAGATLFGYDYRTGELVRTFEVANAMSPGHHLRCYRSKATDRFIIYPKRGAEFLGVDGTGHMRHDWLRGSCRFGVIPCNGLLYTPPDQCFCYVGAKLDGLVATSSATTAPTLAARSPQRLTKGPAFGASAATPALPQDWPAYRANSLRSGSNDRAKISSQLQQQWVVKLGGKLTQPTIAAGKVFVAAVDRHTVYALDASSGELLWKFVAGGRVDSSPTYHDGSLLFGANDGCVYCLDAAEGELAWRFLAAPSERRIGAFGQLESAWPVHGSVLMMNSLAYFAAGRSTLVDGGAHFYALEPATGNVVHYRHVEQPRPDLSEDIGEHFAMDGSNVDVLTSDGKHIFCMQEMFDGELNHIQTEWNTRYGDRFLGEDHLIATGGLLDDTGFNRIFWSHGNRWPGFYFLLMAPKSGNLLVFDEDHTWATKWFVERNIHSQLFYPETTGYLLYCDKNSTTPFLVGDPDAPEPIQWLPETLMKPYTYDGHRITNQYDNYTVEVDKGAGFTRGQPTVWQEYLPVRIEAMALTRDTLFAAGPPDILDPDDPLAALEGRRGGILVAIDPTTGKKISDCPISSPPRFDGMAAAGTRLFLVTREGTVTAWE